MNSALHRRFFLLLLALVTIAFCWILLPYFGAIFWAATLALVFNPLQQWLVGRFNGRRNLAAMTTLMICFVMVIIPGTLIITSMVQEGASLYQRIRSGDINLGSYIGQLQNSLPPSLDNWLERTGIGNFNELRDKFSAGAMQGSQYVATQLVSIGQNTVQFVTSIGVMIYLMFFFFRDGPQLTALLLRAIPLSHHHKTQLLDKFAAVVRATVKGNVIIAIIQGCIGGVTLWSLGVEAALLWGVMMSFLSLLPAIGAALVWIPVVIYFLAVGAFFKAAILSFVGVVVIGLVDNLLRPPLVGKDTKMPDYVVLTATIGGMSLFGINGFVIGPLIAALFMATWALFIAEE